MIVLEKCNNSTSNVICKSESEIETWLEWKYLIVLQNESKFIHYKFGDESINERAKSMWFSVNGKTRLDYVLMI